MKQTTPEVKSLLIKVNGKSHLEKGCSPEYTIKKFQQLNNN